MSEIEKVTSYEAYMDKYKHAFEVHHASQLYKTATLVLKNEPYGSMRECWWIWRELARMLDGTYTPILPQYLHWNWIYSDTRFYSFMPVVARGDKTKISYIPDERHGLEDRRVITKIGRFLTANYAGRVLPERIAEVANAYAIQAEPPMVHVARTKREIIDIYSYGEGLKSCMAGKPWTDRNNPMAAYNNEQGSLPIGVLYIKDVLGRPTARCVARFDRDPPQFGRIYGNEYAMRVALTASGYVAAEQALHGCELVPIMHSEKTATMCVPYFDAPSRYALINIPKKRIFAAMGRSERVNEILKKHNLGTIDDGNNLLLETGQYGVIQHDALRWLGVEDYLTKATELCTNCSNRYPRPTMTVVHGGSKVCQGCLRANYVSAVWNTGGDTRFIHGESDALIHISCVGAYVIKPLRPEDVYDVVWSTWQSDYIRSSEAMLSSLMGGYINRNEACGYRHLHFDMKKMENTPKQFAVFAWLLDNMPELLIAEHHEKYPHLISAVWLDRDFTFHNLQKYQGVDGGEEKEPKTPWGSRLTRLTDWVITRAEQVSLREFRNESDGRGIQERFADVTRCSLASLPVVQKLLADRAVRKDFGDALSYSTVRRPTDEDLDDRAHPEARPRFGSIPTRR